MEDPPVRVPTGAKQTGEARGRWSWAEPSVWTERMLRALEEGMRGGKRYSLTDKVYAPRTLRAAIERVKANDGAPGVGGEAWQLAFPTPISRRGVAMPLRPARFARKRSLSLRQAFQSVPCPTSQSLIRRGRCDSRGGRLP